MDDSPRDGGPLFGIKEVAERTGLPPSTIRYYDQQFGDYLEVQRGSGRRRLFSPQAVERLLSVQSMLKEEGLSLRQVRQRLSGAGPEPARAAQSGELARCREEMARLEERVNILEKKMSDLLEIQKRTLALVGG